MASWLFGKVRAEWNVIHPQRMGVAWFSCFIVMPVSILCILHESSPFILTTTASRTSQHDYGADEEVKALVLAKTPHACETAAPGCSPRPLPFYLLTSCVQNCAAMARMYQIHMWKPATQCSGIDRWRSQDGPSVLVPFAMWGPSKRHHLWSKEGALLKPCNRQMTASRIPQPTELWAPKLLLFANC